MKTKSVLTVLMFLVSLIVISTTALAQDYTVNEVEVDGVDASEGIVFVERGQDLPVRVEVQGIGTETVDNVRVRAWIGGYEHGDLTDKSEIFEVEPGVIYPISLELNIPDDVESGETYTLHVEVFDSQNEEEFLFDLRIQEKRHEIQSETFVRDEGSLMAGRPVFVSVHLENNGDRDEEDLKVEVSIPELGIKSTGFVDQLDKDDSTTQDELFLRIPEDAETDDYNLITTVTFNDGHDQVKDSTSIHVEGKEQKAVMDTLSLQVDSSLKSVAQGKGAVYVISFVNSGTDVRTFTAQVSGTEGWAIESRVDPAVITVQPDDVGEFVVFVAARENADLGRKQFTVKVLSEGKSVGQASLGADVVQGITKSTSYDLQSGLLVGFVVLVVILVILGIIIAFQKIGKDEETGPEQQNVPTPQTYY